MTEEEYNNFDKKKIFANAKVLNILHYAFDVTEYINVSGCISAKEVGTNLR